MTTISGPPPIQGNTNYSTPPKTGVSLNQDNEKKIVIEITPGDDNVTSGDRSKNTAQISITTPNNEFEAEVSREQVFNAVERRTYKNILQQPGDSPSIIKGALVAQSDLDSEDIATFAYLNVKQDQIETYSNATQNSPYNTETSQSNDSSEPENWQKYNEAKNAYMKSLFIVSKANSLDFSEKA